MATNFDEFRPFDSGAGSNVLEAGWRRMARLWLPDGIAAARANLLAVTESSPTAMSVKVDTGEVWIQGHHGEITAAKTLPISPAHATLARKDLVVARVDFNDNVVELDVLTGTPHASPSEPTLTQNTAMWEIDLALVDVPAADTAIGNAQITRTGRVIEQYPGQIQCRVRRVAGQSIGAGATAALSFDTEDVDTDGFIAVTSSTVTIPAGFDGLYALTGTAADTTSGVAVAARITAGGRKYGNASDQVITGAVESLAVSAVVPLVGGQTVTLSVTNPSGGAVSYGGTLDVIRLGPA